MTKKQKEILEKGRQNLNKEEQREYAEARKVQVMENIDKILADVTNGKEELAIIEQDQTDHEEYREPLAITETKKYKIQLSTGGDADGFIIEKDEDGENIISGKYYWADWGVYEEVDLTLEEAEKVAQFYYIAE